MWSVILTPNRHKNLLSRFEFLITKIQKYLLRFFLNFFVVLNFCRSRNFVFSKKILFPKSGLLQNFKTIKRIKNIQNYLFWSFVNKNSKWDKKFSRLLGVKIILLRHQWIHTNLLEKYNFQFQVPFSILYSIYLKLSHVIPT